MSNAAETSIAYVEVTNFGDEPSGTPTLTEIPFSGETLKETANSQRSNNINPAGRAARQVRTSFSAGGDINADFVCEDFDDFISYAVRSSGWSSPVTDTDTIYSIDDSDGSLNRSSGSFVTDGFTQNSWIKISGFSTNAANNCYAKLTSVAATKMVLATSAVLVTEAAGDSVTVTQGSQVVDGVDTQPIYLEKNFTSNTNDFVKYSGVLSNFGLTNNKESQIQLSMSFLCKQETSATATLGDGSNTAASGNEVLNTVDHILAMTENGVAHDLNSFSLTINPNLEGRNFLAQAGFTSVRRKYFDVTGSFEALYKTGTGATLVNKFLNDTTTSIAYVIADSAGNAYVFDIPQVKLTDAPRNAPGNDQDVVVPASWAAEEKVSEDAMIRIVRF